MTFDSRAFGRRIAAARVWRGLEPKQVAQHLGVSPEAINRWERGGLTRPPARGQLRLLSEILEQPEEWLVDGTAPPWLQAPSRADGELADVLAQRHDELIARLDRIAEQLRTMAVTDRALPRE